MFQRDGKGPVPKIARRFGFEQQLELPIPLPAPEMKEAAN
jgi:hypothetical protein